MAEERLPEIALPGDLIVCRTNASLVECVFKLLKRGIRAVISGKDMNSNLQSLAREVKGETLSEMRQRLEAWHDVERQRLADCEARANTGNDVSRFSIDWKAKGASCPQGKRSVS